MQKDFFGELLILIKEAKAQTSYQEVPKKYLGNLLAQYDSDLSSICRVFWITRS